MCYIYIYDVDPQNFRELFCRKANGEEKQSSSVTSNEESEHGLIVMILNEFSRL